MQTDCVNARNILIAAKKKCASPLILIGNCWSKNGAFKNFQISHYIRSQSTLKFLNQQATQNGNNFMTK